MVTQESGSALKLKIFIGFAVTSELKMHLNHSIGWKHARMHALSTSTLFEEVHFHQKEFVGCYIENKPLTIEDLQLKANALRKELLEYCPSLDIFKSPICIFPQLFVA